MANGTRAHFFRVAPNKVNKIEAALRDDKIYIGWPAAEGVLAPRLTRRQLKAIVADGYPNYGPTSLGIAVAHLWRFIREMPVGSLVVVPPMDDRRQFFYVARIASEARHYRGRDADIALERGVEWLNGKQAFLRKNASPALKEYIARAEARPLLNIFDIPTRDDFETTLAANPWVRDFDCPDCDEVAFSQFRVAFSYLSLCRFRRTKCDHRSTYSLKHDAEEATGRYVSERAYILAALLVGFRTEVRDRSCFLNIASDARARRMIERLREARRKAA